MYDVYWDYQAEVPEFQMEIQAIFHMSLSFSCFIIYYILLKYEFPGMIWCILYRDIPFYIIFITVSKYRLF